MTDVILKQFEAPDETRPYAPGWRWSEDVGIVISGRATAATDNGTIGDEPYVSVHLMGANDYASHSTKEPR